MKILSFITLFIMFNLSATANSLPQLSFGVIADCQYADRDNAGKRHYRSCPEKLKYAIDEFNRLELDFIVNLGDFIDKDWSSFQPLLNIVKHSRAPFHFALGNHDFDIDDKYKSQVLSKLGMPARYYSFTVKNWVFLVLDGNDLSTYGWARNSEMHKVSLHEKKKHYQDKPAWNGGIGKKQLDWINQTLHQADKKQQKAVIFCHFPIYPENKHNLWNAKQLLTELDQHQTIVAWFNGHNHDGNYGLRNGIHYVNFHGMLDTENTAYSLVDIYEDKIEIKGYGREKNRILKIK